MPVVRRDFVDRFEPEYAARVFAATASTRTQTALGRRRLALTLAACAYA